jgi:nitroreductase
MIDMTPDELLATTRTVRKRLDFDRPVPRALIEECIELAIQAPSGSNTQRWHFIVVEDQETKDKLADIYRRQFAEYEKMDGPQYAEGDPRQEASGRVKSSASYLADNFHRAPAILIPCQDGRPEKMGGSQIAVASYFGSILPAVWSFMLAARARGLGTAWTTMHLAHERDAAEVLGIPYERVAQVAMIPVAFTIGTDFKRSTRLGADEVIHWDTW